MYYDGINFTHQKVYLFCYVFLQSFTTSSSIYVNVKKTHRYGTSQRAAISLFNQVIVSWKDWFFCQFYQQLLKNDFLHKSFNTLLTNIYVSGCTQLFQRLDYKRKVTRHNKHFYSYHWYWFFEVEVSPGTLRCWRWCINSLKVFLDHFPYLLRRCRCMPPVRSLIERNLNFSAVVLFNDGKQWKLIFAVAKNLPGGFWSSHLEVLCKKSVLRNFTKFSGKHLYQNLFFNKVAVLFP